MLVCPGINPDPVFDPELFSLGRKTATDLVFVPGSAFFGPKTSSDLVFVPESISAEIREGFAFQVFSKFTYFPAFMDYSSILEELIPFRIVFPGK